MKHAKFQGCETSYLGRIAPPLSLSLLYLCLVDGPLSIRDRVCNRWARSSARKIRQGEQHDPLTFACVLACLAIR